MEKRTFWEQLFPRILATGIAVYLVYYLGIRGDALSSLHIWMLVIMLALVLAPMARRLDILNLVHFDSRLGNLQKEQQETKAQLSELSNQISSVIDVWVKPEQHQTTVINMGDLTKLIAELDSSKQVPTTDSILDAKNPEQIREAFLSKAEIRRGRTFSILTIAREFQEAILEHKAMDTKVVIGDTFDEKICRMSKDLVSRGINILFPFTIEGEDGNQVPTVISEITEGLDLIENFLDIRKKVENRELTVPNEVDSLLQRIELAILDIEAAIIVVGTNLVVTEYNLQQGLAQMRKELNGGVGGETMQS